MQKICVSMVRISLIVAMSVVAVHSRSLYADNLPEQLSDAEFWAIVTEFSEDGGFFRSDNFVSNEEMFQYVIPALRETPERGGAYLGVGPEQNFTYIVALEPRIAFIFDLRRQNMLTHLIYKAIFEMSADRADFLSLLFSRQRPEELDAVSTPKELFAAYAAAAPEPVAFEENLRAIKDRLVKTHGFELSKEDTDRVDYVYRAFFDAGPDLNYSYQAFPAGVGTMPTYADLMTAEDGQGHNRSYLASEENFRMLQAMHRKNLIVPLVGDFAGDRSISMVAQYLKDHDATVSAFYTSNVEQYLFQRAADWNRFYNNVATLPIDSTSVFIRSVTANRRVILPVRGAGRFISLLCPMSALVNAFNEGRIRYYDDVILLSQ